ncbi:MAG: FAD-dependent oxidoreductase [Planctomycetota bacterium]
MSSSESDPRFIMVGAGLAGSLMAVYLGQAGYEVAVYERRSDPRHGQPTRGRSINLALSVRGIHALGEIGAADEVLQTAVAMKGRMMHDVSGELSFQPYGTEPDQVINSVSRAWLNRILVERAERLPNVQVHFDHKCVGADLESGAVGFVNTQTDEELTVEGGLVIGADGAFSAVRSQMQSDAAPGPLRLPASLPGAWIQGTDHTAPRLRGVCFRAERPAHLAPAVNDDDRPPQPRPLLHLYAVLAL